MINSIFVAIIERTMFRMLLIIGIGGALGSICRFLTDMAASKLIPSVFPFGTFAVNILGCLLIGIAFGLLEQTDWFGLEWRLFVITGFCGGYTTFSTFAADNIRLLHDGQYLNFATYTIASVVLGIAALMFGLWLIEK
ncbi:MAG: fluoride efflux transporter CrcB [Bacteroidia bacterium]|jgi:CrcB protein|nr:fluoride efflux transporter CrcB [Bacteroidota bacterium]MCZ2130313.1 fluoride efflux transporter CrcB [Bacteroidia bacterium]